MRRESLAGSLVNGASWGGMSVGSLLRDDILMQGTSPYNFQSPSFHSSSYLPKMEANFMRDFICCGITFEDMHDLVNHYEEVHRDGRINGLSNPTTAAEPMGPTFAQAAQGSIGQFSSAQATDTTLASTMPGTQSQPGHDRQPTALEDVDSLDDMELDDATTSSGAPQAFSPQQQTVRPPSSGRAPPLNTGVANALQQHQGLRSSTPSTPRAGNQGFQYQYNPTVSSVNTPTLNTPSVQQPQAPASGAPSAPSTPAAATHAEAYGTFNKSSDAAAPQTDWDGAGLEIDDSQGFIDNPGKRLSGKGISNLQQANIELLKRLREQQLLGGGVPGVATGLPGEEVKPFKCPVVGCEKAYKNQNGLKYHKQHGHQKQQLKENTDGTFSIVDPLTSAPYPGTEGMEKEKPYRCEVCGKRYKNLNGLKYHRQHSPMCNPDLANMDALQSLGAGGDNMLGLETAGMAAAGFAGMNEQGIF